MSFDQNFNLAGATNRLPYGLNSCNSNANINVLDGSPVSGLGTDLTSAFYPSQLSSDDLNTNYTMVLMYMKKQQQLQQQQQQQQLLQHQQGPDLYTRSSSDTTSENSSVIILNTPSTSTLQFLNRSTNETLVQKSVSGDSTGQLVKLKRPRRRFHEVERIYKCTFEDCTKAYGTLNHLNSHVLLQKHGPKRFPKEFQALRALRRREKKRLKHEAKKLLLRASSVTFEHYSNTPGSLPDSKFYGSAPLYGHLPVHMSADMISSPMNFAAPGMATDYTVNGGLRTSATRVRAASTATAPSVSVTSGPPQVPHFGQDQQQFMATSEGQIPSEMPNFYMPFGINNNLFTNSQPQLPPNMLVQMPNIPGNLDHQLFDQVDRRGIMPDSGM